MPDTEDRGKDKGKDAEKEGGAPKKPSRRRLFIIIGVLLLAAGGGGGYVWMQYGGIEGLKGEAQKEAKAEHEEEALGEVVPLQPFIVNLNNDTSTRYLKVSIHLEVEKEAVEEVELRTAQIRDTIIILLSSKTLSDVGTIQGKYQLRDEIAVRVNQILNKGKLKSVYFTEFVIQ